MGVPLIAEYYLVRHVLEPDGLRYTPLIKRPGSFRWRDVKCVRYSPSAKWFRIELADRRVVRISGMLMGLPEFARAVLGAVPPSSIDLKARRLLEQTAAGSPLPIWRK